jgi:hypothetical protein
VSFESAQFTTSQFVFRFDLLIIIFIALVKDVEELQKEKVRFVLEARCVELEIALFCLCKAVDQIM